LSVAGVLLAAVLAGTPAPAKAQSLPPLQAGTSQEEGATGADGGQVPLAEPPDPDPFGFGSYRGRRPQYMDTSVVNGATLAIAHLLTDDPPEQVLLTYREQFKRAKVVLVEGAPEEAPGMRYLSFRPEGSKRLKTVTLLPHGKGTMILVSVGDPSPMLDPSSLGLDLPMPRGAGQVVQSTQGEGGRQRHASFEVRGLFPTAVMQFYEDEMPRRGYRRGQLVEGAVGSPLTFTRGEEQVTITATSAPTTGSSRVTVMWIGGAR